MEYEQKARMAADRLLSYRDDQSGWQVCKKSVSFGFTCTRSLNDTCTFIRLHVFIRMFRLASSSKRLLEFVFFTLIY